MPSDMKPPSVEQILKRKISGQSVARMQWNRAKSEAGKVVDVKLFKDDLGPKLDALNQLYQGALDVKKYYPVLDDRTKKPVATKLKEVEKVVWKYKQLCKTQAAAAAQNAPQVKAWNKLHGALELLEAVRIKVKQNVLD